ncbi:MAG TPA: DNA-processing protein DprA [Candidatus Omnitrophota bacterium]|nr:DNA-processing protein DprA [Candidatus Omnitrophota bacterium]
MDQRDQILALNAVPGLGPQRVKKIFDHFGCGQNIFALHENDLLAASFLPDAVVKEIKRFPFQEFLSQEHQWIAKRRASVVTFFDQDYPSLLREIADPPIVLYACGNCSLLKDLCLAVVGCRKASVYGIMTAERLAEELAQYQLVIVSGLAKGIDAASHRGALRVCGKTIAVLGTGLNHIYPQENKKLFEAIAEQGLILSEFSMSTPARSGHFPRRNRIVSGLSLGVVVVEAAKRSGALITADLALEQGRDVFAVPGKIDAISAQGTNILIQQGAKLISCAQDVLDELGLELKSVEEKSSLPLLSSCQARTKDLRVQEKNVLHLLSKSPITLDALCQASGLPMTQLYNVLLSLELKGFVRQMPGKLFVIR